MEALAFYIIFIPILLISITIHEFAHAFAADRLGDPTPRLAGRLTLNPINHIDPIGFLMLLIIHIGWAKPVPINPYNFKNPRSGMVITGLAGPISNFIFAWMLVVCLKTIPILSGLVIELLQLAIWINLALIVFNLLPIPPLDGSRIFSPFLPVEVQINLERYGFIILIAILLFPGTSGLIVYLIQIFYNLLTSFSFASIL